jgi:Protein of unknown function (DUF1592)/Protein of unknown function (DUF1588)/Protein of unknown function (DUF1595)/Protein of unknown function (DUF1587)/Protein of unknown function (DUF1585)
MRGLTWITKARGCLFVVASGWLLGAVPACSGTLGDPYGTGEDGKTPGGEEENPDGKIASHLRFPRLSHSQWERTVIDLFRLDSPTGLSASFSPDPLGGKAFDNNEAALQVTPNLWADYQRAAEEVALLVTSNPALLEKIAPPSLPQEPAAKKKAFLESFGKRTFRRPLTADEVTRFTALFDEGAVLDPAADPFVAGVRLTIEAFLQSPFFVYRPELSFLVRPDGKIPLNGYEVATRLSYALWGTMPDDSLFEAADTGKLNTLAGIEAEARRLLASDRARETIVTFHDQLYHGEQYLNIDKSPVVYPEFDPAFGADARRELELFVDHVLYEQKGGLSDLLTSRTTFVNARLAAVYGLDTAGLDNDNFVEVELPEAERSGLLTRAGFLAYKGTKTQPDTILRGVFINRRILCQDLGDPPDAAVGAMLGDELTNREKVTALTGKGTCGESCHGTFINPAGFALEHFGAMGEYRTEDNGVPINAVDTFPFEGGDRSYDGAIEFSKIASETTQSHRCYSRYWLEFLYGRDLKTEDAGLVTDVAALSKGGGSVEDIVVALVTSDAFLTRPVEVVP